MDEEKRQMLARASFLLILAVLFTLMFIWATVLNFGYIRFTGEAPFDVDIWGDKEVSCDVSPCKIKQKTGVRDIVITRPEMQPIYKEVEIGRWGTTDIKLEFSYIPELKEVLEIPSVKNETLHEIVFDEENKMYKLIQRDDPLKTAIVYFPREIKDPQIFSSDDSALIIGAGKEAYKVDFVKKEKVQLNDKSFGGIIAGEWSPSGKYFAFTVDWSDKVLLLDEEKVRELSLYADSKFGWTYENQLLFAVSQQYLDGGRPFEIELLPYQSSEGFTFGQYDPSLDIYRKIETFDEIKELPKQLVPVSNGRTIYLETAEKSYKIDF